MQLALHVLNSLSENISSIKRMQLDRDIETEMKKDKDIKFIDESDLSDTCTSFKKIYYNFVSNSSSSECVEQIVRKHKDLCWNDLHPHSEVMIVCYDKSEIQEATKWLEEKHVLHCVCKIDSSNKSIEKLKKIALDAKVSLDDFWKCHVGDDEWIRDNIDRIKTPIFIELNDVSIYSKPGIRSVKILSIGFDKDILSDKLMC